jgi:hypothetical protein
MVFHSVLLRAILIDIYHYYIEHMIYNDENDQLVTQYRVTYDPQFLDDMIVK